jgi:glycosyltransferase involved in cell wall biosynthesis
MRKPVITIDMPGMREIFGNSKCGLYVTSINADKIAHVIEFSLQHRDELERWGKEGRTIILNRYSWSKVAIDFETYLVSK